MPSSQGSPPASPNWNASSASPAHLDPALIRGIAAYRRHPWQRTLPDPPALWTEGASRLLDYGPGPGAPGGVPAGPTVLFVPSMVNRAYILDLMPRQSMMRWLAGRGIRPLLLDWGWPGEAERRFTLTDIVAGRLERALMAAGPVVLAGYCMGGMLALAAALRRPDLVRALVLLATPWDFHAGPPGTAHAGPSWTAHAGPPGTAQHVAGVLPALEPLLQATGTLPVDALQALFAAADPGSVGAKFRAFGMMDQASDRAERFVALEDWLNDGVPLPAMVAREALSGWYGANAPARGEWRIAGQAVQPGRLAMPCFAAVPGQDRIVSPASALALAGMVPGAVTHRPDSGHVGMAAGPRAAQALWTPLLHWLHGL